MEWEALKQSVMSVVRHVITTAGGAFVSSGVIAQQDLVALAGAAAIVVGIAWGVVEKQVRK